MSKVFIPKLYKKEPPTIRLTPEKLESIDKYAAVYKVSRSEFLNQCIDFALEHIQDMPADQKNSAD